MKAKKGRLRPVLLCGCCILAVIAGLVVVWPVVFRRLATPQFVEGLRSSKQIKLALDGFAIDYRGQYPNRETLAELSADPLPLEYSSDFFRQLILAQETQLEAIFHIRGSEFCRRSRPGYNREVRSEPDPFEILGPGENGWSYFEGLTNISAVEHPLIVGAFRTGGGLDREVWQGRAVAVTIDSSARALPIQEDGSLLDDEGRDLMRGIDPVETFEPGFKPVLRHPEPIGSKRLRNLKAAAPPGSGRKP